MVEETMGQIGWDRRAVLGGLSAAAGLGVLGGTGAALAQEISVKWSSGTELPQIKVPPNACDCHHHIYDSKYPVDPKATLRPGDATVADYKMLQKRIGTTRHVIVQPSTYGTMNAPTLDALVAFGPEARAVAVVDTTVSDAELKHMNELGVRGIRFNLAQAGATTPEMLEPLSKRVNDLGWHIQINATADKIMEIMPILQKVPSPIVFDHLAHIPEPDGVSHPLFKQVLALIDKGSTWVKLSGAYADTKIGPPTYADSTAVAQAYVKGAPERLVWGSDWPHPSERETKPDDAVLIDLMLVWAPDEKVRNRIFVDNAATLYGFPKA
jgi:D-galactarolactone isomerase